MVVQAVSIKPPPPPKIVVSADGERDSELAVDHSSSLLEPNWDKEDVWEKEKDELWEDEMVHSSCLTDSPALCQHHDFYHSMGALSLQSSGSHIHGTRCCSRHKFRSGKKNKHEVPLLSRIPLYDKIMAEQEERRRVIHERNSKQLRALVQPFSFTKREEEERHGDRCSSLAVRCRSRSQTPFKARPVPRHLLSDAAYDRMREDQFYRALRKNIRADEMLKAAAMPPSMEAREKLSKGKSKSLDFLDNKTCRRRRVVNRGCRTLKDTYAPGTRTTGTTQWRSRKGVHAGQSSTTDSSADGSPNASTLEPRSRPRPRPHSSLSISRSNLASVLRVQNSRSKLEHEIKEKEEEREHQMAAKFKERLIRLSPAWRQLDYSTEEDLALRLEQRRQEARLRGARHRQFMESVYGRVHQIPPLFQEPERTHSCPSKRGLTRAAARSRSLESNLEGNKHGSPADSRKCRSFYLDRSVACKSPGSSQLKSATDSDSIDGHGP